MSLERHALANLSSMAQRDFINAGFFSESRFSKEYATKWRAHLEEKLLFEPEGCCPRSSESANLLVNLLIDQRRALVGIPRIRQEVRNLVRVY